LPRRRHRRGQGHDKRNRKAENPQRLRFHRAECNGRVLESSVNLLSIQEVNPAANNSDPKEYLLRLGVTNLLNAWGPKDDCALDNRDERIIACNYDRVTDDDQGLRSDQRHIYAYPCIQTRRLPGRRVIRGPQSM